jgi:hypothetical protein
MIVFMVVSRMLIGIAVQNEVADGAWVVRSTAHISLPHSSRHPARANPAMWREKSVLIDQVAALVCSAGAIFAP